MYRFTLAEDHSANLRHDLLAVVHTLSGAVELVLTTRLTARQRRYVNVCKRSAENLSQLLGTEPAPSEGRNVQRLAVDDLAKLGVTYMVKPVTQGQLVEIVKRVDGGRQLRVLAADDSPESCTLIAQFLKGAARRVDIVNDGQSALQKYRQGRYDLLIVDLDMPIMDGRTTIREIRAWELDNRKQPVPVIVLTAHELMAPERGRAVGGPAR